MLLTRFPKAAFEKSRAMQQVLVKIQQSLRRMPGVSSAESSEIVLQLQEVGQIISRETSDLVSAVMNLTLDQEDTDKAVARMSIEANIAKAQIDDQCNTIQTLQAQLQEEMEKKAQADEQISNGDHSRQSNEETAELIKVNTLVEPLFKKAVILTGFYRLSRKRIRISKSKSMDDAPSGS